MNSVIFHDDFDRASDAVIRAIDALMRIGEVPETDEPPLCTCGKHYVGAPCPVK